MDFLTHPLQRTAAGTAFRRAGSGASVVLLHGIPGSAASWTAVAADLAADHDVIVPDLLGFGASDRPTAVDDLHARGQATALRALLDDQHLDAVSVIGHDFGGPVAITLAATAPDRINAIGLLATNVFTDTPIPFPLSSINWPLLGTISRRLLFSTPAQAMMLRQGVGKGAERLDPAIHLGDRAQRRATATIFGESLTHLDELYRPIEDYLPQISVPRFVAWGDDDPFFPIAQGQRVADALNTGLHTLAGAGHYLPHERPTEVADLIRSLVSTVGLR